MREAAMDHETKGTGVIDGALFARLTGTTEDGLGEDVRSFLRDHDFTYEALKDGDHDRALLDVIKEIDRSPLARAGKGRHDDWERGWAENLKEFRETRDIGSLVPKYMFKLGIMRLLGGYIRPGARDFLINFFIVYMHHIFREYLQGFGHLYEFGCGPGRNLALMARMFPEKRLYGLDWAQSSVDVVNEIASHYGFPLEGRRFDFFHPDETLAVPPDSAFITLHSMEQLGSDYHAFLRFMLEKKPALCINVEPLYELYQEDDLLDYLAMKYHAKRNYLTGYVDSLRKLEKEGTVEIVKTLKVRLGNYYHDSFSTIIWKPYQEKP